MSAVPEPLALYADEFAGPGPVIHPETAPFWTRLAEHRMFSVARCTACGTKRYPLAPSCPVCLSFDHEWVDVRPQGTVSAAVQVYRATGIGAWQGAAPYVTGLVDLDDGFRVPGRLLCGCGEALAHGTPVSMCLVPTATGAVVHAFAHRCYAANETEESP